MAWHTAGGRDVVLGAVDLEGDAVIDDAIESHAARCLVRASELDKGEASFVVAANKQTNKDVLARSQWGGRSAWQSGSYSRFGRTQHRPAGTHMLVAEITGLPGASACPSDNIACSAQSGYSQVKRRTRRDLTTRRSHAAVDLLRFAPARARPNGRGRCRHGTDRNGGSCWRLT